MAPLAYCAHLRCGLRGEDAAFLRERLHLGGREGDHPVLIADDDVAVVDHESADGYRNAQIPRSALVRSKRGMRHGVARKVLGSKRGDIANRAADHETGETTNLRLPEHELAHQGAVRIAAAVDHEDVAFVCQRERLVDDEVVARTCFHGEGRSDERAGTVILVKPRSAAEPIHAIADIRRGNLPEQVPELRDRCERKHEAALFPTLSANSSVSGGSVREGVARSSPGMTLLRLTTGTIALYVDLDRDHARAAAIAIAETVRALGFAVASCNDAPIEHAVLLVTIGGDGTLLRAAQIAAPRGIPLFGINTGRLGFLTELDGDASAGPVLGELLRNGFTLDRRMGLEARLHSRSHFALNDVVVRRTTPHMAPFGLYVDGKEAARVPADGIAVSTPTGSTAYFLSAGGPILAPDVEAFGVTALLPHTLFTRPLVVPSRSTVEVLVVNTPASVEADGRVVDELAPGDRVTVIKSPHEVAFARRAPLNFFSLLEDKLRWNAPIKERSTEG